MDVYAQRIVRQIAVDGYTPELVAALCRNYERAGLIGDRAVGGLVWVGYREHMTSSRANARVVRSEPVAADSDRYTAALATAVGAYNEAFGFSYGSLQSRYTFLSMLAYARFLHGEGDYDEAVEQLVEALGNYVTPRLFNGIVRWRLESVRVPSRDDMTPRGGGWPEVGRI